ncbi:MAG: VapC toxin family PIN domain ribonuclease, partial [Chloroflexi bacterium]
MSLFVDPSASIAFLDEDEGNHERAVATFDELLRNVELVTHNYVVLEA